MDFEKVKKSFEEYLKDYDLTDAKISLKREHSYTVSDLMTELAFRLGLDKTEIILAKIIGLLHDIGRFEQWTKYGSFNDKNVDHADESCNYLFKDGHIRDFIDEDQYDSIIENAIRYHNKYKVPELDKKEALFTKMIRDMDKVDTYKQSAIHYNYTFNANDVSSEVLKSFKNSEQIETKYRKTTSDAILVMLGFIFDINFDESFDILVETDNFDLFLSTIEVMSDSEDEWKKIREICFDKINKGCENYE